MTLVNFIQVQGGPMLERLQSNLNLYTNNMPREIGKAALISGLFTFFISALTSQSLRSGFVCAGIAATVSLIGSLVLPIFKYALADDTGNMKWYSQAVNSVAVLGISQVVINYISSNYFSSAIKVNLYAGVLLTMTLNLLLNGFKDRSADEGSPYMLLGEVGKLV